MSRTCRAIKLLDIRAFELKSDVHEVFDHVWNTLIQVDVENQKVSISSAREGGWRQGDSTCRRALTIVDEPMSLEDAVIGLKAYKEVDQRMDRLWQEVNRAILLPRLDITRDTLPKLHAEDVSLPLLVQWTPSNAERRARWKYGDRQRNPSSLCLQTSTRPSPSWLKDCRLILSIPFLPRCYPKPSTE